MSQNKMDIIFRTIYRHFDLRTDHHHAYNRRSEITHINLVTCNGTEKVWRSASKNLSYISIFTCRILETLRSIVPAITQKKLSNQFLVHEAEWNVVKMNRSGKCESEILLIFFISVANLPNLHLSSKFLNLKREILFYIICAGESDIDRRKFCRYMWDNLFQKSSVEKEYWFEISISDRNKKNS